MNNLGIPEHEVKLHNILKDMGTPIKKVNAYNGWDPLKQVILGNCFNPSFFEDVKDPKVRHLLQKLLYETQEDLDNFQKEMELAGVDVVRIPANVMQSGYYAETVGDAMDHHSRNGGIPRPMITPRDMFITLGKELVYSHFAPRMGSIVYDLMEDKSAFNCNVMMEFFKSKFMSPIGVNPCTPENLHLLPLGNFPSTQGTEKTADFEDMDGRCLDSYFFDAPFFTRVGDTIVVDEEDKRNFSKWTLKNFPHFKQAHIGIGGHNDGTFCPLKPGHIVTAGWHVDYSDTFPGWDVHVVTNDYDSREDIYNRRHEDFEIIRDEKRHIDRAWWSPDAKECPEFSAFISKWLKHWTGWSIESIFEVNALVINPELVFFSNYNKGVFDYCESIGITPHIVPFRHRHFWDGGLHCLTLDVYREGGMQNYFE